MRQIEATRTYTVSGFSSGAFFSVQLGVAYSSEINGIGVVAGGAYYCAYGSQTVGVTTCLSWPWLQNMYKLKLDTLTFANEDKIDATANISKQRVYLFSANYDLTIQTGVVLNAQKYFNLFGAETEMDVSQFCAHGMVTNFYGNQCFSLQSEPYIINCRYDLAGKILQYLYNDTLNSPIAADAVPYDNVIAIDQAHFVPDGSNAADISLYDKAYVYVASNCSINPMPNYCSLHVVLHGCLQDVTTDIGDGELFNDSYVRNAGYNQWAETNDMVILYPQAISTAISNPGGCWDWWGYTSKDYAFKTGKQMSTVHNMIQWVIGDGQSKNQL